MASAASRDTAIVGVADHGGWAVLVTVASDGRLLDRRRVELIEQGLPALPHHHDAQGLPAREAVELVERVRASANRCAIACLEALATTVSIKIAGLALRTCPPLPPSVAERISNYRAQNVADWVMYREALAGAAKGRGWAVHWYDAREVLADAARNERITAVGKAIGPPWQKDHRMAMAAALVAAGR